MPADLHLRRAVYALADTDATFADLTTMLYGSTTPETVVAKMSPDASAVHVPGSESPGQSRGRKWALRVGLAGAYAGGALAAKEGAEGAARMAGREVRVGNAVRTRSVRGLVPKEGTVPARVKKPSRVGGAGKLAFAGFAGGADAVAARLATKAKKEDQISKADGLNELAAGALKQSRRLVANILGNGGDAALHAADTAVDGANAARRAKNAVAPAKNAKTAIGGQPQKANQLAMFGAGGQPALPGTTAANVGQQQVGLNVGNAVNAATATPGRTAATAGAVGGAGVLAATKVGGQKQQNQLGYDTGPVYYSKSEKVDFELAGTFSKLDTDKRLAFGWASVCKVDGEILEDRQGDLVDPDQIEDLVYEYNLKQRTGGDMHLRTDGIDVYEQQFERPGDTPVHVADLVESIMFTAEKKRALGLPDDYPEGWWVGFKYHDDDVWDDIKSGRRGAFSVHGTGIRIPEMA